jgi:hypothetical protein
MGGQLDGRCRLLVCGVTWLLPTHISVLSSKLSRNWYLAGQHTVFEVLPFARSVLYDFSMCFMLPGDVSVPV